MNDYIIYTDSACDIPPELLKKWGVECISMTFTLDSSQRIYKDNEMPSADFYNKMRNGTVAKTAAINTDEFTKAFTKELSAGKDVLYLCFSSGLSGTCGYAKAAAEELKGEYPANKVIVVDSLSASGGFGLLVYLTAQKKSDGASLDETVSYVEDIIPHICHWFTVDDLKYLKRGGRISPAVALVGGLLGIKPVLHTDDEGHLVNVDKVRGRKAAVKALADKYTELAEKPGKGTVFICHADCMEDAEYLAELLKHRHMLKSARIMNIGTVIGAHSGPGTLALFFVGKNR